MRNSSITMYVSVLAFVFLVSSSSLLAQVGIGTTTPHASAQLEISSTNKGLLIPRMDAATRSGISSPATGLLVYQTDGTTGFYYYNGSSWQQVGASSSPESFSAYISTLTTATSTQLTGWSVASPYYSSSSFNETTGNYTVPATGTYAISATINYSTTAAITTNLDAAIDPAFVVRRTSPTTTDLIAGVFPILNVNIALVLTLRTILGSGCVTLSGKVNLTAGDVIGLFYVADGLTTSLNLGGSDARGIVWTITKL